jgi:malate synthase
MTAEGVHISAPLPPEYQRILSDDAMAFIAGLHREFDGRRRELLEGRATRLASINAGEIPDFLAATQDVRHSEWRVPPVPDDLQDRRVEITGPTERKMMINALNSGAKIFMADFEDSNSPTWHNMVSGHINLGDAIDRSIEFKNPDGKEYRLNDEIATLLVRPRGWHLDEKHVRIDGRLVSGSLFDFGLYVFHNARNLLERGSGPYFYLAKLENHLEARLWNDVFLYAQDALGIDRDTIKATVLIETILAAFEMDEILHELQDHSAGLNAGRWDYIFSIIKKFRTSPEAVLPDRNDVTMAVPFMRAYTQLLIKTCHRRGAHAIGGMSAFIPSRKNPEVNENALAKVHEDKERESGDGHDGTWVAHPDLVPPVLEVFDRALGDRPNQLDVQREDVEVTSDDLMDFRVPGKGVTEEGIRSNVSVGIQYIESWLRGVGAAAINNLMEDAATSEISRSQIWQWVRHSARLEDGRAVDRDLVQAIEEEELENLRAALGDELYSEGRFKEAQAIFERVSLENEFEEFLTVPAYDYLD